VLLSSLHKESHFSELFVCCVGECLYLFVALVLQFEHNLPAGLLIIHDLTLVSFQDLGQEKVNAESRVLVQGLPHKVGVETLLSQIVHDLLQRKVGYAISFGLQLVKEHDLLLHFMHLFHGRIHDVLVVLLHLQNFTVQLVTQI